MAITLVPLDPAGADRSALIDFMSGNEFPFHVRTRPGAGTVAASIDDGEYDNEDTKSFWLDDSQLGRIGFVALEDLTDPTPLFDLRIASEHRGRGLGTAALTAITHHVFTTLPVTRFEGQTRADNYAMRTVFLRCGWVKEAHYRESWPVENEPPVASVAYALLRRDWESGTTTPVPFDDFTLTQN